MARTKKNKYVTAALAWFLGVFGVHRFYLGQPGLGVLYLCTFGVFGIASTIDAISYLVMPEQHFDVKHNNAIPPTKTTQVSLKPHDVADETNKQGQLIDKGLITLEESERRKAKLLQHKPL